MYKKLHKAYLSCLKINKYTIPLGQEDPLEKEMATHSNNFACEIPWTEESGRLQSMGLQKSWT